MANKKHILTKKTAQKASKKHRGRIPGSKNKPKALSQTPAAIAKRRERERKLGQENKPTKEILLLSILPPRVKLKKIEEIKTSLEKEESQILDKYPSETPAEKLILLKRLEAIMKEAGVMDLYHELLLSEQLKKKSDA